MILLLKKKNIIQSKFDSCISELCLVCVCVCMCVYVAQIYGKSCSMKSPSLVKVKCKAYTT